MFPIMRFYTTFKLYLTPCHPTFPILKQNIVPPARPVFSTIAAVGLVAVAALGDGPSETGGGHAVVPVAGAALEGGPSAL